MATVRMKKGSKYADIFDSPEMIAGAKADGYELVTEREPAKTQAEVKEETPTTSAPKTSRTNKRQ